MKVHIIYEDLKWEMSEIQTSKGFQSEFEYHQWEMEQRWGKSKGLKNQDDGQPRGKGGNRTKAYFRRM